MSTATEVVTVLGRVAAAEMGIVDAHSHVWIVPPRGAASDAPRLDDEGRIARELRDFRVAGGATVVDCQPGGCGRDGAALVRLSRASGVHLIAATGFHRARYYRPHEPLLRLDAQAAADHYVGEIRYGLTETRDDDAPVYPGVIKMAAEATLAASPRALFEGAAEAARATGYAVEMHTEQGAAAEDCLAFFTGRGLAPDRLVFCHVDKRPDLGLHRELAAAGVMLEYDTFFRPKYHPDEGVWPLLVAMLDAGLADHVALATDLADSTLWRAYGGHPGLAAFLTQVGGRLREMSTAEPTWGALMGENIARRLARGRR